MTELTFKQKIEKLPTLVLLWNEPSQRAGGVIMQYSFIASLATLISAFPVFYILGLDALAITMWSCGGFATLITGIACWVGYYESTHDLFYDNKRKASVGGHSYSEATKIIKENISRAARISLEDESNNVKLSEYIHLSNKYYCQTGGDSVYLQSLSQRHIKWATKYYHKQIKKIKYHQTIGAHKQKEELEAKLKALDGASSDKNIREIAYHLKALKDLEKGKSLSTLEEELDSL